MLRRTSWIALVAAILAIILMSGCGGGGDGDNNNQTQTGSVSGRVVVGTDNPQGLGNVTVIVGGVVTTTDPNGNFLVQGVPPGRYEVEIVPDPDSGFAVPPTSEPITVTVIAGGTTDLEDNVTLVDEEDLPPEPPGA